MVWRYEILLMLEEVDFGEETDELRVREASHVVVSLVAGRIVHESLNNLVDPDTVLDDISEHAELEGLDAVLHSREGRHVEGTGAFTILVEDLHAVLIGIGGSQVLHQLLLARIHPSLERGDDQRRESAENVTRTSLDLLFAEELRLVELFLRNHEGDESAFLSVFHLKGVESFVAVLHTATSTDKSKLGSTFRDARTAHETGILFMLSPTYPNSTG